MIEPTYGREPVIRLGQGQPKVSPPAPAAPPSQTQGIGAAISQERGRTAGQRYVPKE